MFNQDAQRYDQNQFGEPGNSGYPPETRPPPHQPPNLFSRPPEQLPPQEVSRGKSSNLYYRSKLSSRVTLNRKFWEQSNMKFCVCLQIMVSESLKSDNQNLFCKLLLRLGIDYKEI